MTRNRVRPRRVALAAFGAFCGTVAATLASAAPAGPEQALAPGAPYPAVVASSVERDAVAPGVERATYRFLTAAGPVVASVVLVDPHEPTVRFGAVLAHDRIVSAGETISSMARRTGAIAGINADYFDIGATGAPLGVVVRAGALERSPSTRPAVAVRDDRTARFGLVTFTGSASVGDAPPVPLAGLNVWPSGSEVSLLTPAFGPLPNAGGGTELLALAATGERDGLRAYRVTAVGDAPPWPAGTIFLALGAAVRASLPVAPGDAVTTAFTTDPPARDIVAAVGGGPMLLHDGIAVDDPSSPNYAERARRIPSSAVARLADGRVALVVVDGRRAATSIGLNRAELAALLRALGASDAMLFDSGGSATLVARELGDVEARVVNDPSDGAERPVADGLFVYSDAPTGAPSRLAIRPSHIVALPGTHVALHARLVDANGHAFGDASGAWSPAPNVVASLDAGGVLLAASQPGAADVEVRRGSARATLRIEVVARAARLAIGPARVDPDPHASTTLTLDAFDAQDRPMITDGAVRWSARDATIDARGRLTVGDRNATVMASAGGVTSSAVVPVGRHVVPVALDAIAWRFATAPPSGAGSAGAGDGVLHIAYDFTAGGRAAYAVGDAALGTPLALSCAIDGDGSGAAVRATLSDRYGDRQPVTLATRVDFTDTRRVDAAVPAWLAPPVTLRGIYVAGTLANPAIAAAGTIGVHDCTEVVPGTQPARTALHAMPATNAMIPATSDHSGGAAAIASAG